MTLKQMHKILLGNYKGLKITPATMYTDNDLELAIIESLTRLTNQWAKNNMPAELGDEVIVTLQAECEALFVPELSKSNFRYSVGDPAMLEQFKQVVSKKAGESFKMEIPFAENTPIDRVGGKTVIFNVTVQEVIPARQIKITDEIAQKIDSQVVNIDELKNKLRNIISNNWLQIIKEHNLQSILDTIISNSVYELGQEEFSKIYEHIVTKTKKKMFSSTDPRTLKSLFSEETDEYFYEDCRTLAERTLIEDLIINEIIRLEKINISDEEILKEKNALMEIFKDEATFKNNFPSEDIWKKYLLRQKTLELLLSWNIN